MFSRRLNILLCALLLAGIVLLARLAQVQIGWHWRFERDDYTRVGGSRIVETYRGGVYTRWGTPLATQLPSFDLGVYYKALDQDDWKELLSGLCGIPVAELTAKAERIIQQVERMEAAVRRRPGREDIRVAERYQHHCVVEDVGAEVAAAVRAEPGLFPTVRIGRKRIPAIKLIERSRREYPNGSLAPHIVGQMAPVSGRWRDLDARGLMWTLAMPIAQIGRRYRMDDRIGASGVEKAREELLRGRRGYVLKRRLFKVLKVETQSVSTAPEGGCDVYLTIREDFQRAANAALHRAAQTPEIDFHSGALVLLDVRDGSVLAAATYPSFDLATYRRDFKSLAADPRAPELFRPTQGALPTGSVYKIITAIAALEEKAIVPSTTFTCAHVQVFAGRPFTCTSRWGHGTFSLLPAIERSCNIYFYNTGLRVGAEPLALWGRRFGLGVPTGVDLPFERSGQVPVPRSTHGTLNLCIGQGRMLCTPLQVANMMAAVANGGRLYEPRFFHHAQQPDGHVVEEYQPEFTAIPVAPETLSIVREGMRRVVESGTARSAGLDGFRAAGKTGTAELARTEKNHAWFAGYAPYEEPRIAFAVVSERTSGHGSDHAAPILSWALEDIWPAVEQMP